VSHQHRLPEPVVGLDAHRMTHLAGAAVRRLRALRYRRDTGALSEDDYRREVAAELEDDQPPSPGCAG
jgi:hypothetical protein